MKIVVFFYYRMVGGERNAPAMQAVMKQATFPAIIALSTTSEKSLRRDGAMAPRAPSWMPIAPRLPKPHSMYVDISSERLYQCTVTVIWDSE